MRCTCLLSGGKADITVCRCPLAVAIRGKTDIDVLRPIPSQGVIWVDNILRHSASGTMVRRREFIKIAAGSALGTLPPSSYAQQAALPVVGFINAGSAENYKRQVAAFLEGLEAL